MIMNETKTRIFTAQGIFSEIIQNVKRSFDLKITGMYFVIYKYSVKLYFLFVVVILQLRIEHRS